MLGHFFLIFFLIFNLQLRWPSTMSLVLFRAQLGLVPFKNIINQIFQHQHRYHLPSLIMTKTMMSSNRTNPLGSQDNTIPFHYERTNWNKNEDHHPHHRAKQHRLIRPKRSTRLTNILLRIRKRKYERFHQRNQWYMKTFCGDKLLNMVVYKRPFVCSFQRRQKDRCVCLFVREKPFIAIFQFSKVIENLNWVTNLDIFW